MEGNCENMAEYGRMLYIWWDMVGYGRMWKNMVEDGWNMDRI